MLTSLSPGLFGPDALLILLIALVAEAVLGGIPLVFSMFPHPVAVVGRAIAYLERKLNRPHRSAQARRVRGVLSVAILSITAVVVGWLVHRLAVSWPQGWVLDVICLVVLLAQRELFFRVRDVASALKRGLRDGRAALFHVAGRDARALDKHGVARAAVESCAENFADAVIAPAFWYLLAGLPGLFLHKTVSTLDSMIGYRAPRYHAFGWAAARLDDLMMLIPARIAGLILVIAALFTPRANPRNALRVMLHDANKHSSPNAGWPEGAMAGALGFALGGPRRYDGHIAHDGWIGSGTARLMPSDIHRALYLYAAGCLLLMALCALGAAARLGPSVPLFL